MRPLSQGQAQAVYVRNKAQVEFSERDNRALAERLGGISKAYPALNPATAVTLAEAGYTRDSPEVRTVGELQNKRNSERSAFDRRFSNPLSDDDDFTGIRAVARTALSVVAQPIELVEGFTRTATQAVRVAADQGLGAANEFLEEQGSLEDIGRQTRFGAAKQVSNQTGMSVAAALNNNPRMPKDQDVASLLERPQQTWLSGTNSLAEKQQVKNVRGVGAYVDPANPKGRAITEGRTVTHIIGFEPGGAAWNMTRGLMRLSDSPWWDDDNIEATLGKVRSTVEGSVDAVFGVAADPLTPISKAQRVATVTRGQFRGPTVAVDNPQYVRTTAKVTDKETRQVSEVPILSDNGTRRTVVFENAVDLIKHPKKGRRITTYLAKEDKYENVAAVLGRGTHPSTVLRVLRETDPARMEALLLDEISNAFIHTAPLVRAADYARVGMPVPLGGKVASFSSAQVFRSKSRLRQLAPSETAMHRDDPAWAVEQYRRMARGIASGKRDPATLAAINATRKAWNADNPNLPPKPMVGDSGRVLPDDVISKNIEEFAEGIVDANPENWARPYFALMGMVGTRMKAEGLPDEFANKLVKVFMDNVTEQRNFAVDAHGRPWHPWMVRDGVDEPIPKASLSAEMTTDTLPVIDVEKLNRAISSVSRLVENDAWRGLVQTGDFVTAIFKFLVLPVRGGAFLTRNVAEVQGRMAVEGMSNIYTSPFAAMALRMGDNPDSKLSRMLGRANRRQGRAWSDPGGEDFRVRAEMEANASQFAKTQETKGGPYNDERIVFMPGYPVVKKGESGHLEGVRFQLNKLAASPEVRMVLEADNTQHAKNLFWGARGKPSKARMTIAQQNPEVLTRAGADKWIDEVTIPLIREHTNGNPELIKAVRQGKIGDHPLMTRDARNAPVPSKKAVKELAKYMDDLPEFVVSPASMTVGSASNPLAQMAEFADRRLFSTAFHLFGSMPMNRFANSPIMREATWDHAVRMAPLGTAQARKQLVVNARKANMDRATIKALQGVSGPPGTLDVDDITKVSLEAGFNRWLDIVYTSHKKGYWTRQVRMINAFAAAMADTQKFWTKRLAKNPLVLHRVEQGMHAARQSGTFYTDENGEERFAYPGSGALSAIAGLPGQGLSGVVKSANLVAAGVQAGFGPLVSWPVARFTPDSKEWDGFRKFINPYGDPDGSGGLLEGMQVRYVQRIMAALDHGTPEQKRLYQEALGDVQAYLVSTGEYGSSESEQERLARDAKEKGKMLWLVQAVAQANVPVSPKGEYKFRDPSGRMHTIALVAADYRKMLNEDFESASQRLLEKYGDAVFYAVGSGTEGTGLITEAAHDLAREHPEVLDRYDTVWSLFTDPNSPYSYNELKRQLDGKERDPLDLHDRQVEAQTAVANTMYYQYRDQFGVFITTDEDGTKAEKDAYLQGVKAAIRKEYPLWDETFDANAKMKQVSQAFAAAKDPIYRDTPAAEAVRTYEQVRAQVRDYYNAQGVTNSDSGWGKAVRAEPGRDHLRQVAAALVKQTPEFKTLWERVFQGEMKDDVEGTP